MAGAARYTSVVHGSLTVHVIHTITVHKREREGERGGERKERERERER